MSIAHRQRVIILTDSYLIKGEIDLIPGARLTDYMLDAKGFLAVTAAQIWDLNGEQIMQTPFMDVARDQIHIISPET
ncbi:MAG: hypothetical protein H0W44_03605 [Gammaproteobacteria bacterium]|nr:hypothetical protein [Gammaproteobacteria bacterium]